MITTAPGCRSVCNDQPGEVVEQLIEIFKKLRNRGWSEEQVLTLSRDAEQVARLLPKDSLGAFHGGAEAVIKTGCAECAVNYAFTESSDPTVHRIVFD